ncbi:MAG: hypothetical protein JXA37_09400 [Chloroflexia bacterium]|nr:hypothetical protein [Chloroflexia bacterium]
MKEFLAVLGIVAILICLWLSLVTVRQGGIRQYDAETGQAEVLTFEGWQPLDDGFVAESSGQKKSAAAGVAQAEEASAVVESAPSTETPAPTEVPPPTSVPESTAVPSPSVIPVSTQVPQATAVVQANVLADASHQPTDSNSAPPARQEPGQGQLPAGWAQDPTGSSFYVAEPAAVSPWEVLGWLLVGALPVGGLLAASLLSYRHVALTNARVEAIRIAQATAPRRAAPQAEPEWADELELDPQDGGLEGQETDIEAYLSPARRGSAA